mmetsp:Transcript_32359/g.57918  ORF Transcript_32359/g.57918 Transcript_32359/m.57918 type:complete len:200 (-) Transcript_32359:527-1126(-)
MSTTTIIFRSRVAVPLLVLLLAFAGMANGRVLLQYTTITPEMPTTIDIPMPGSDRDANGCIGSAGYQWCESTQQCYRSWEEECPGEMSSTQGNDSSTTPTVTPSGECPGAPGIFGGWTRQEGLANDGAIQEAAQTVVNALLGPGVNQAFVVETACTQVVAGTNYFLEVDIYNKGNATAVVYQPPGEDAPMSIVSLQYDN